ncbi:uncharacterized protein LOC134828068 [Culicoides brevitarsis]|uniref:uncharacterized protein LOC134828068 n=1 Tax=Culicoides brevitarsis TaxID=469753 RepID=UPI00307CBD5F
MPAIYDMDDQEECFFDSKSEEFNYCIATTIIKPDNTSSAWNVVQYFNASSNVADGLTQRLKLRYDRMINICVNRKLQKYSLQGFSTIVYCKGEDLMTHPGIDKHDYLLVSILVPIIILLVIASFSNYLRRDYREQNKFEKYLYCFSVQRNWVKLTSINSNELTIELGCVQTVRLLFTLLIVYGHVVRDLLRHPTKSPEYFEQKFHSVSGMFLMNGVYVVQTFFIIGGFMWAIAFTEVAKRAKSVTACTGLIAIALRYLRLTPVYAIFMALQLSSVFMPTNIFLRRSFLQERENCRANGWSNLLYINNYYRTDAICVGHSWYLSADFQNAIVGTIILICASCITCKSFCLSGILRKFFNFPLFQILARLTYCMYLVHKTTQGILIDNLGFTRITSTTIFTLATSNITMTLVLSFILSIAIEFPFTSIMKLILQQKPNNNNEVAQCSCRSKVTNERNDNDDAVVNNNNVNIKRGKQSIQMVPQRQPEEVHYNERKTAHCLDDCNLF